jgi:hypothetical protein
MKQSPPSAPATATHSWDRQVRRKAVFAVIVVAIIVVVGVWATWLTYGTRESLRVECVGVTRVGNVSAWYPFDYVAAPFNGSENGMVVTWQNISNGTSFRNLTTHYPTSDSGGNVSLAAGTGGNWSIYTSRNESVRGNGLSYPCSSSLVAILGPANSVSGLAFGGGSVASDLRTDRGLPSSLNASELCADVGDQPKCAVSATFDVNYSMAGGQVDTCGKPGPFHLNLTLEQLGIRIPFQVDGTEYSVPIGPAALSGAFGWSNYTFPGDGGVWDYQVLPGVTGGGAGPVFSYSPCP